MLPQMYKGEGYDSTWLADSGTMARSYAADVRGCTWLFECAWFGEVDTFSYRDQPGLAYAIDRLGLHDGVRLFRSYQLHRLTRMAALPGGGASAGAAAWAPARKA